ncbi:MAG: hypothetical protein WC683_02060 [bacterium]
MTEAREILEQGNKGKGTIFDESYSAACEQRWAKMLSPRSPQDPINHRYIRRCTAMLLENQMGHVKELQEDTLSTNAGAFTKYAFPVLRRVFPNLIANQLVSVQPMTSPVGGIFYYEKKYDDRKGTKIPQLGITNQPYNQNYGGQLGAGDNINENFARYYSSEYVDYDVVCTQTGGGAGPLTNVSANCRLPAWSPMRAPGVDAQRTFSVVAYYRTRDNATTGWLDIVATLDPTGVTNNLVDQYGTTVGTLVVGTGAWSISAFDETGVASIFQNNTVIYLQYYVNWEQVGSTNGAEVPSIGLDIALYTVKAESRKLKAHWSVEAADDMRALHGIDAETELVSTFANEVLLEVDREIVDALVTGARFAATYTYAYTAGTAGEIETIRNLITKISAVGAEIHRASGRSPANFIVVPPGVGALLDQLSTHGDFASIEQNVQSPSYGPLTSDFGIARVGTLLRRYAVYQDPYMAANKVLVGLKGNSYLDAGYVYAPYVPLQITPSFLDPADFRVRKGVRTRYASRMLRPEYYGVITCAGLPTVTTV